jgi:hypothetical protein
VLLTATPAKRPTNLRPSANRRTPAAPTERQRPGHARRKETSPTPRRETPKRPSTRAARTSDTANRNPRTRLRERWGLIPLSPSNGPTKQTNRAEPARTHANAATSSGTEERMNPQPARPTPQQPNRSRDPHTTATDCGAVAATTSTGGVGLRPPCHSTHDERRPTRHLGDISRGHVPGPLANARTSGEQILLICRLFMSMRARGLEPPRAYAHRLLRPACLPIPPRPRGALSLLATGRPLLSSIRACPPPLASSDACARCPAELVWSWALWPRPPRHSRA